MRSRALCRIPRLPWLWAFVAGSRRAWQDTPGGLVIPEFVETGMGDPVLPPGIYRASAGEILSKLVTAFPKSRTRSQIFESWSAFSLAIRKLVPVQHEYLDGSFVTGKLNPKDIDLSLWINRSDMEAAEPNYRAGITGLFKQSQNFRCDAILVAIC